MPQRYNATIFVVIGLLAVSVTMTWAGAGNLSYHCIREAVLLPHVCQGGVNDGQQCSVSWQVMGLGPLDCIVVDNGNCGSQGKCVIDYTNKQKKKVQVSLLLDDDATTGQQSVNRALTLLLCLRHQGKPQCFTETYLGDLANNKLISLPPFSTGNGEMIWDGYGALTKQEQRAKLVQNFQFSAPEGLVNPDGDLAQGLRDLLQVTGIPLLTEIGPASRVHFDDHANDLTGSILRFDATLQFVDQ